MSLAAAVGVLGAALTAARMAEPTDSGAPGPRAVPEPASPAPAPTARPLSFDYGDGALTESIDTPRAGICYPLSGPGAAATAFRNNSELRAQLQPSPGCGGSPGPVLDPGQSLEDSPPSAGVVFTVTTGRAPDG
jgi:hypothetical protein